MTFYCRHCRLPAEEACCPRCGRALTWPVLPEDPCFLTEQTGVWAGLLEEVLRQGRIPFQRQSAQGAALMTMLGSYHTKFRFYVPYEYLSRAGELVEGLFGQNEDTVCK